MTKWNSFRYAMAAVICTFGLTACGSGDGDGAPPGPTAEGVYGGKLTGSPNSDFQLLVLENGDFWAMYGVQTPSGFGIAGFIQGSGTSKNGSYASSSVKDFGFIPAVAGAANATYDPAAKTISGALTFPASTVGFNGGPIVGSLYNYDTPASLPTVTGSWNTSSLTGETVQIDINAAGVFGAVSSLGCHFSGTVAPRPSGKNVFNVSLTFGPAPCVLAGEAGAGIAVAYPLASGVTQLLVAVTNTARTVGTAVVGTR